MGYHVETLITGKKTQLTFRYKIKKESCKMITISHQHEFYDLRLKKQDWQWFPILLLMSDYNR